MDIDINELFEIEKEVGKEKFNEVYLPKFQKLVKGISHPHQIKSLKGLKELVRKEYNILAKFLEDLEKRETHNDDLNEDEDKDEDDSDQELDSDSVHSGKKLYKKK